MKYVFDLDGTLCTLTNGFYKEAEPKQDIIDIVNYLFDLGHEIVIFTARGQTTGTDHYELTAKQLKEWGVKYHCLRMGKESADYYIDDKAMHPDEFMRRCKWFRKFLLSVVP
jgi:hypothetical protein